ncbi:NAD(P)/FAD-dependent oxidoreductase (plasmid) [Sphingomonas paeninsulae]|uniref:NAD(P)/FAD-dependent oxidoreductase n=2 Tax=Sphingomonas paeninsulae TaxID=2319844 RepID=A0A494TGG0_SPHPE|nr:NAD(P)/FAD-dependent oxidoreductase [Sphingomonas paeninsulae]
MAVHAIEKLPIRVVIIGAGMSGILMGIRLKEAGITNFTVYEKGDAVGGTWRENSYPGLHCDVPSLHYCYSFDLNPTWTREFSPGAEIHDYFKRSAEKFGITPHVRLNTAVTDAKWIDGVWRVSLSNGESDSADVLVSAVGVLHIPIMPEIPGKETFAGASFHTTKWDHSIDLGEKSVGVIGTGSTAVQIVTELAGKVSNISMFQRTPQWVAYVANARYSERTKARLRRYPFLLKWHYEVKRQQLEALVCGGIMGEDEGLRAMLVNNCEGHLATVRDPDLRSKLTPNYEVGCKRLVTSPRFYEAIQRPDAKLVTAAIEKIVPDGIVTEDGQLHSIDVLAYATGFDPLAYLRPMTMTGRGGHTLEELWAKRPTAYRTIAVPHMPNFFMLEGPFSPVSNLSLVLISERQANFVMKCIELIRTERIAISPRPDVTDNIIAIYRERGRETIFATGGCQSYFLDDEGVPIYYSLGPASFFAEMDEDPDLDEFEIGALEEAASA